MNLNNKTVVLGVTGSIAAYKAADVVSALAKQGCDVHVIMTKNATEIVTPLTFSNLSGNNTIVDTFDKTIDYNVAHVALAKRADVLMIAPATANVIAKLAHGLADDMLTTTTLACTCPKIIAPAMNTAMFLNPVTQDNLKILADYGWEIVAPATGVLACKDVGTGKLPKPEELLDYLYKEIAYEKDLAGKKVLITAGPTQEAIDPVRYITNHSSGKMGYALARNAMLRGAEVTLVSGPVSITPPPFVKLVKVTSAQEMFAAVKEHATDQDIIIKAAAVADYRPAEVADQKMKKTGAEKNIDLSPTDDILAWLGQHKKPGTFLCGFAMETENLVENAGAKLARKNADMIVANNLFTAGAGFKGDTNVVTLITAEGTTELPQLSKDETAEKILDAILAKK